MEAVHSPFLVREQIRAQILKRIEALDKGYRQNMGLVGPEGRGKTATLHCVYQELTGRPSFLVAYVDATFLDYDHFAERWIGALLTGLFLSQSVKPPSSFQSLMSAAEPIVPKTVEHIRLLKKMARQSKVAASVRELFSLPSVLAAETGKKIILMIDEFHLLEGLPVPDAFALLGKEIMVEKNALYLVASSSPTKAYDIFREKLSLLFGNFEVVSLKPFGFEETRRYLMTQFPESFFQTEQIQFFIRMTDSHPVYLAYLSHAIRRACPDHGVFSNEQMLDIFLSELFGSAGAFDMLFSRKLSGLKQCSKDSSSYVKALLAVGSGRHKILGIATFMGKKTKEVVKILQRLVQEDFLSKRGAFYVLGDPLFAFWLKEIYQRRNQHYIPDQTALKQGLRVALEKEFDKMREEEGMDITARVEALFKEFRNDVVEMDQKKFVLPQFSEIAFRPTNGRVFPLLARNTKVRWLCQIAGEQVHEEDVVAFLEESKRYRKNVQRRILVTLSGIDQNAKLMAQEAQIQLWDLRNFNSLLDLYDLPKVISLNSGRMNESIMGPVAESLHSA